MSKYLNKTAAPSMIGKGKLTVIDEDTQIFLLRYNF
jgi:hypothetical protein